MTLTANGNGRRVDRKPGDHVIMFGRYDKTDSKWDFTPYGEHRFELRFSR